MIPEGMSLSDQKIYTAAGVALYVSAALIVVISIVMIASRLA